MLSSEREPASRTEGSVSAAPAKSTERHESRAGHPSGGSTERILLLQRLAGNRAVSALVDGAAEGVGSLIGRQGQSLDNSVRAEM